MAWITEGTVSLTNGSANVLGTGTTWLNRVGVSDVFIGPNGTLHEIASIQSGTQLTLVQPYAGTTAGTAAYKIFPTQAYNLKTAIAANELVAFFQPLLDAQLSSEVFNGRFLAGTVAAPGIAFTTATGTGFSAIGSNVLVASTGSTEAFRVDGSQNFGIGMTPSNRLDVFQNNAGPAIVQITNPNAGTGADSRVNVSNGTNIGGMIMRGTGHANANQLLQYVNGNNQIGWSTNGVTRATIAGDGTTTFSYQFVAAANANFGGNISLTRAASSTIARSDLIGYAGMSGGTDLSTGMNMILGGTTTSTFAGVTAFRYGTAESMRINSAGNVSIGMGAATVNRKLTVGSDSSSNEYIQIRTNNTGGAGLLFSDDPTSVLSNGAVLYDHTADSITIRANSLPAITAISSGNVGVRVVNPITSLHVASDYLAGVIQPVALFAQNSSANPTAGQGVRAYFAANNSVDRAAAIEAVVSNGINGHHLGFLTNVGGAAPTEKVRIGTIGEVSIGNQFTPRIIEVAGAGTAGTANALNIESSITSAYSGITIVRNDGTTATLGPTINLARTRGASVASQTAVTDGDTLGGIAFSGADGSDIRTKAAEIVSQVDGVVGASIMPGRLIFSTTSAGFGVPSEKARLTANGRFALSTTTPLATLDVSSGAGSGAVVVGADSGLTTRTNVTTKVGRFAVPHYTTSELSFGIISGVSNATDNVVEIGANTASLNPATRISLYTATTRTGGALATERMRVIPSGNIGFNVTADPTVTMELSRVGTNAATNFRITNQTDAGYGQIQYIGSTFATVDRQNNFEILTNTAASDIVMMPGVAAESARFTAGGKFIFGTKAAKSAQVANGPFVAQIQAVGTGTVGYSAIKYAGVTAASAPAFVFGRSRGTTDGSNTAVIAGDYLGYLSWGGADGTNIQEAARITAEVGAGTISATSMPGDIVFSTSTNGAVIPSAKMRLTAVGNFGIGVSPNASTKFHVLKNGENVRVETTAARGTGSLFNTYFDPTGRKGFVGYGSSDDRYMIMNEMNADLTIGTNAVVGIVVKPSGRVMIGSSLTDNAAGGSLQISSGITFPATQVASADANTLDDYEEGTFTPTIIGTTAAGVGTYSTQSGTYTKIGNRVLYTLRISWTAHTGTGNMLIGGLPFTASASAGIHSAAVGAQTLTFSGQLTAYVTTASTTITLAQTVTNAAITGVAVDTTGDIWISGSYNV